MGVLVQRKSGVKMKKIIMAVAISLILGACVSNPDKIPAAYVSPQKYANYDCQQLAAEAANIERKVNDLYGHLKKENSKDKWATGVGVVLFWPALFFLAGNENVNEAEYAQLQGDYEAIQSAQVQKRCTMSAPAPALVGSPSEPSMPTASATDGEPVPQLRVVSEEDKDDCKFIKSITKGAGGSGDVSIHLEKAMNKAQVDAANAGADSYFIANVSTTSSGASVVLEALNCNGEKSTSAIQSSGIYDYYVNDIGEDRYEAIKQENTGIVYSSYSEPRTSPSRFPSASEVPRNSKKVFLDDYEGRPVPYPPPIETTPKILGQKNLRTGQ